MLGLLLVLSLAAASAHEFHHLCPPCVGPECGRIPDGCRFGVTINPLCERAECRKGPGEECYHEFACVEGLSCRCGRCSGCSAMLLFMGEQPCYKGPTCFEGFPH